jgi:hypothetical protein
MAFHLALYHASLAGNVAITQLNALGDAVIAPAANGYLVPSTLDKIMRVAGTGGLLMRAQLRSASLDRYTPFDISPVSVAAAIGAPAPFADFASNPIPLDVNEELDAFILNSAAGPTRTTVGVWFCDGPVRKVNSRPFTVRWTNAVAAVAFAWTAFQPVFDNGLPSGTFAIVGSRCFSATGLFHRFLPRGGTPYRPGTFCVQADGTVLNAGDRYGDLGEWMRFTNTTAPQIETFCLAADAACSGYMDLVQVG